MGTEGIVAERYEIIETLGQGSYGTVYLVREVNHWGMLWALKEIVETGIPEDERDHALKLFRREAEILGALSHPGLPSIKEFFSINEKHYLVMEYVDGENLEVVMELENGHLDYAEIIDWAIQLGMIIEHLHNRNPEPIVFRDLKPSNIMLTFPERRIMLVDFGIARYFDPGKLKDTQFLGTLGFSPPEQYGRGQSDQRSDIYSYGATLYYLLTNLDMKKCSFQFSHVCSLNADVPNLFGQIIMKCLSMNPGERFQSMNELLKELYSLDPETYHVRQSQNLKVEKVEFLSELSGFYFTGCTERYPDPPCTLKNVEKKGSFTSADFSGTLLECHCRTHWVRAKEVFGAIIAEIGSDASGYREDNSVYHQKQTTAMVKIEGAQFPKFLMRSESFLDTKLIGKDPDIDFEDNPVFSKSFFLTGPDREAIMSFFRPDIIEIFSGDPVSNFKKFAFLTMPGAYWIVEAEGPYIIFYIPGAVIQSNSIQQFIEHAEKVMLPFIRKAKQIYGGKGGSPGCKLGG